MGSPPINVVRIGSEVSSEGVAAVLKLRLFEQRPEAAGDVELLSPFARVTRFTGQDDMLQRLLAFLDDPRPLLARVIIGGMRETGEHPEVDDREALAAGPSTETSVDDDTMTTLTNGLRGATLAESTSDASARFDALVKDRDALRVEVSRLRQSIEELQAKHEADLEGVREQLQETQGEKEEAVEQYQSLLGKVNTIQERLKERLKADAVRWHDVCTLTRQALTCT